MAKKKRNARKPGINQATNRLLMAAGAFVDAHGGKALVAGDTHIMGDPSDPYRFTLCVKMTGLPPKAKSSEGSDA